MLTIKKATLINGHDSDELDVEALLNLIKAEEDKCQTLEAFQTPSKAIEGLVVKHLGNIDHLVSILDAREV